MTTLMLTYITYMISLKKADIDSCAVAVKPKWQQKTFQGGAPLGNDKCKAQIEAALGWKVGKNKRGRPVNERGDE